MSVLLGQLIRLGSLCIDFRSLRSDFNKIADIECDGLLFTDWYIILKLLKKALLFAYQVIFWPILHKNRTCIAQWLERPLGVQDASCRSPTASHQRRKKWEVCASQLGAWH